MRPIDANALIAMYKGNILTAQTDYAEGVRDVIKDIKDAPIIKTKQIKYFDEDEAVWKIGRVIVDE